jgi:uncharacterized SAM-binding protein YcdF (DUF218 family)
MLALIGVWLAVIAGAGVAAALTGLRIRRTGILRAPHEAEAVVVLGAAVRTDGTPCRELDRRLRAAAALMRANPRRTIVCCGGRSASGASEAVAMRLALIGHGASPGAVVTDENCPSTRQAVAAAKRRWAADPRPVVFVSSDYHVYRILREARRQSLPAAGHAVARLTLPGGSTGLTPKALSQLAREVLAVWWYALSAIGSPPGRPLLDHDRSAHLEAIEQLDQVGVPHLHTTRR